MQVLSSSCKSCQISNSTCSICLEHSLNLKGPMLETGPLMKGVSVALEKCSWQHLITHRQEDSAPNHCQPTPNAKWQRTREANRTSMHFQEATASLLLSKRRWPCKQFEITQPKGHEQHPDTGMGVIQQQILARSHLWCWKGQQPTVLWSTVWGKAA
jgi:hypothetical protein